MPIYMHFERHCRHYVFGLSVRPSVLRMKYPLSTCTWVCWSIQPTVTILRHVRLSIPLSIRRGFRAFDGECMMGMDWNICLLMYLDHFQNWLHYGHSLLIFQILTLIRHSEKGEIWGFQIFSTKKTFREWLEILYFDVSWPPSELVSLWSWFVGVSHFGGILT